jgi:hypothetical protein
MRLINSLVTAFMLISFSQAYAGMTLDPGTLPAFEYNEIRIQGIRKSGIEFQHNPRTRTAAEHFEGTVTIEVSVEGNLCLDDSETVGVLRQRRDNQIYLSLIAGHEKKGAADGCAQFGMPSWTAFVLPFRVYFPEPGQEESLGVLLVPNQQTGAMEKHDVRVVLNGKVATLKVVVLP